MCTYCLNYPQFNRDKHIVAIHERHREVLNVKHARIELCTRGPLPDRLHQLNLLVNALEVLDLAPAAALEDIEDAHFLVSMASEFETPFTRLKNVRFFLKNGRSHQVDTRTQHQAIR